MKLMSRATQSGGRVLPHTRGLDRVVLGGLVFWHIKLGRELYRCNYAVKIRKSEHI